jgi:hypothetical protein
MLKGIEKPFTIKLVPVSSNSPSEINDSQRVNTSI